MPSFISVGMPHKFAPDGPSSRTPQRNFLPTSLSSKSTSAVKQGQPSSALPEVIGVSLQVCAKRPDLSQLPASRALRKMSRLSPVKYLNCTAVFVITSSTFQVLTSAKGERAESERVNEQSHGSPGQPEEHHLAPAMRPQSVERR